MTNIPDPYRNRIPRDDLDPAVVARAKRLIRARERRDRWARIDFDNAEAADEAKDIYRGGNR